MTTRKSTSPGQVAAEARRWLGDSLRPGPPEVWSLDFVSADGSLGVVVELGIRPSDGTSWFWFFVAGPDRKLIALVDDVAPVPAPPGLELRAPGLWTELNVQVALDHLTFDLEAFGVELDDPTDLLGSAYGTRVALGGELEWDTAGAVIEQEHGYELPCEVHGELLIDDQTIELTGTGWRGHWWGADRLNDGFRGVDQAGVSVREPASEPDSPLERIQTPAGVTHRMLAGPHRWGWWRGSAPAAR